MNKKAMKETLIFIILAIFTLVSPVFVVFYLPQLLLSLWATGVASLHLLKRQNPRVVENKKFQWFEKLLYFQIINWTFAGFLWLPTLVIMMPIVVLTLLFFGLNPVSRAHKKFQKWCQYVGFHIFNLALMVVLFLRFPNVGYEAVVVMPTILFLNGVTAAFCMLTLEKTPNGKKKGLVLALFFLMMVATTVSLFPQATGLSLFQLIF